MKPCARLRLPDGTLAELEHGDVIGRLWSAALLLDHPSISEAHALLSLREGAFWLLSLRRRLAVDGVALSEVRLEPGLRVELAPDLALVVEELALPDSVPTLETERLPPTVLPSVCSVRALPRPHVVGRFDPDAPCVIWTTGDGWRMRLHGKDQPLHVGHSFQLDGETFRIGSTTLDAAGPGVTRVQGGVHAPLLLVASFDTVHLHREGEPTLTLTGVQARILSELVALGGPAHWRIVSDSIWPADTMEHSLRKRWDVALTRLRTRLREARVRTDLVRADGRGNFELVLRPEDRVEDRT